MHMIINQKGKSLRQVIMKFQADQTLFQTDKIIVFDRLPLQSQAEEEDEIKDENL